MNILRNLLEAENREKIIEEFTNWYEKTNELAYENIGLAMERRPEDYFVDMPGGGLEFNGMVTINRDEDLKSFPKGITHVKILYIYKATTLEGLPKCAQLSIGQSATLTVEDLKHVELYETKTLTIASCDKMHSLKGIHKYLTASVDTIILNDVDEAILGLIMLKDLTTVFCRRIVDGKLEDALDLIKPYYGKGKEGVVEAQAKLIDADLDDFADL